MSNVEFSMLVDGPERQCPDKFGGLLKVFPPEAMEPHERMGVLFQGEPCLTAISYDPDVCVPGTLKMDPSVVGPEKEGLLGMLQSAIKCSTIGLSMEELREDSRVALRQQLDRAIDTDLVTYLETVDVNQGTFEGKCGLAAAAQWLNNSSQCGRGIIFGPVEWFVSLENVLVWQASKGYHTDYVGNIVIPHSVDNDTVYAFDMAVDIKISDVMILDELSPGIRTVNDRVVRAEQLYLVLIDSCEVASFTLDPACCAGCGIGGGGGGPIPVTDITDDDRDVESLILCDFDANGDIVGSAVAVYTYDELGNPVGAPSFVDPTTGAPYVPQGTLRPCATQRPNYNVEVVTLCDVQGGGVAVPFFVVTVYDEDGEFVSQRNEGPGGAVYTPTGTVRDCNNAAFDFESVVLCDDNGPFIRRYAYQGDGSTVVTDLTLGGTAYVAVGTVGSCEPDPVPPVPVPTTRSHMVDLVNGAAWTPAALPPGETLTGITLTIITGDADLVDVDGTAIANLPVGFDSSWSAAENGTLQGPQSITSSNPGRTVLTIATRV